MRKVNCLQLTTAILVALSVTGGSAVAADSSAVNTGLGDETHSLNSGSSRFRLADNSGTAPTPPDKGVDNSKANGQTSLSAANQAMNNPITDFTLFITENNTTANQGKITTKNRYQNVTLIEPLLPVSIGDSGYNLINRPVIPLVSAPVPEANAQGGLDWDRKNGLGDIVFFSLLKPPSTGNFQWGLVSP